MKRLLLALLLTVPAGAAPSLTLVPLKPNLYVVEDKYYAAENSMVYVGRDHVTVIGATWTPATAELLVAEIKKVTPKPVTEVIDQNHDLDRTGGNAYFQKIGARIIAIQATRDLLAKEGVQQISDTRKFAPDYPDVPVVLPDTIVGNDFTLQDGAIRGLWLGASHKPDDIFVWFPKENVLYGGCALKPMLGNTVGADLAEYPKTLARLKALNLPIETIVAGHGAAVQGPDLIDRYLGFLEAAPPAPYTVVPGLFDTTRPDDLGLKPAPGMRSSVVFKAGEGSDHYVNGVALIAFKGKLYAQWQSSAKDEDAPDTHVMIADSRDGIHWSKPRRLSVAASGMLTSGGWWTDGKTLTAYINVWNGDIHLGGRSFAMTSTDGKRFTGLNPLPAGVIEQDTHALPGGRLVTAFHLSPGLKVAPFYTDDPQGLAGWTRGAMTNLPREGAESRELEPAWFRRADGCLVMVFRDQENSFRQLASQSCDRGRTWTAPVVTAMPDARQKQSAGNLPDGTAFLVHAPSGNKLRSPLVLSLSKDGRVFDRAYLLRAGPPPEPHYPGLYKRAGYHYPKATVWNGALWAGYANAKEEIVVVRVALDGLH